MRKNIFILIFILALSNQIFGQLSDERKRALYIPIFAENVLWPNDNQISELRIGVYGNDLMVQEIQKSFGGKNIRNKKIYVKKIDRIKDMTDIELLYIDNKKNEDLNQIIEQVKGQNILLITDRSIRRDIMMVNLLPIGKRKSYEVFKKNIEEKKMVPLDKLLIYGGTEDDLIEIIRKTEDKLKKAEKLEREAKQLYEKAQQEITTQKTQIERQKKEIDDQQNEIVKQTEHIENQKLELDSLLSEVNVAQKELESQMTILDNQKVQIKDQQKKMEKQQEDMEKQQEVLNEGQERLEELNEKIEEREEDLAKAGTTIQSQAMAIYIFIAVIVVILFLIYYIFRSYQAKKALSMKLEEQNAAINTQKEEILAQSEQLELTNLELEKLSIVARETDNAVVILNSNGDFEWVNESYSKIFGYTLEQLVGEISVNIIGPNTPEDIVETIQQCISGKETVTYQFPSQTRTGNKIWIQANLTPILDRSGNITKIIAVDSDITKIKEAEEAIREQSKEIAKQRDNYLSQKNKVEKAYHDIKLLSEFGQKLSATLEIEAINDMIYDYVNSLMHITAFGIGIYNSEKERIEFRGFMEGGEKLPFFHTSMNQENSLSVYCVKNQHEVFINDLHTEYKNYLQSVPVVRTTKPAESVIYIPLMIENHPIGVVTAQNFDKNAFSENNLAMLQTLASYLAIALDNAHAYKIINTKNQHISGSIRYAKTIQQAILPMKENMDKYFNSFTIYRPKDVVSGDFYWYSVLPQQNGNKEQVFIAAVDCTGHGVPGAFMSMIGNRLLNEIVNERKINDPKEILSHLDTGVKQALKQEMTDNNDGMDVCLVNLEAQENGKTKIVFSGAKRPLFYRTNGTNKINTLKGTRRSIGGARSKRNKESFIDEDVLLEKGDVIYLTSDGIMDQNSPARKRFGTDRFVKVLEECSTLPLEEQKRNIEFALDSYQQNEEQRDDVTIIGVQL